MGLSNVTVLDGAMVPEIPIWPRKGLLIFLGVMLGAVGGMGVAFLLEYMDDSVRTQEDLEATLGLPLLGYVPRMEGRRSDLARRDLVSHREPKSTISEFFRTIRTGILYSSNGDLKSLMVTSAGPKEGKTTNAINLAITLAAGGSRVLLVDGDLRRARIHQAFGVPNEKGLSDLLTGGGRLEDLVQETDVENLHLLTSGPLPPNPAEILGTPAMRGFLEEASEAYDRVILDTPPVVAVTDACILASSVDGVIQVVASSKTSRKVLERGKSQLQSVGARLLGVILNDVRVKRSGYDSYYYAGYYRYSS
jgi:capsular exopolysaccharide synthesis family protein